MKNLMKKITLVAIAFLAFSCAKPEDEKTVKSVSIAEIATVTPELSSFVEALDLTGLTATFENEGNNTVFVPNNDAFANMLSSMGYGSFEDMEADKPGLLANILKYHVLPNSRVLSTDLTDGATATTLLGETITVNIDVDTTTNTDNISITDQNDLTGNDSNIIARDIKCSNGTIHLIDNVLLPAPPAD
ncbi:fasciclin domain-containing protein [Flavobacterium phycosphaerae]|uniref:fasciclin domain-containing protein n=1 Tax=Flavobacterium phycosphaerae TaxID=2697515 RepID=UPI00138A6756|nr:fasciclin domain-containing protein [Flavobacterium phycosphaerae]